MSGGRRESVEMKAGDEYCERCKSTVAAMGDCERRNGVVDEMLQRNGDRKADAGRFGGVMCTIEEQRGERARSPR